MLDLITPLILTRNESANVSRCLERLEWASMIIVVDSFSSDNTPEIVTRDTRVRLIQRHFDNHTEQWNFGLSHVTSEWALTLDADYILPETLQEEISRLRPSSKLSAYFARFQYCILGKPLRSALYPPRAVLFRVNNCKYVQDGHTQILSIAGESGSLRSIILHDDRKPLTEWFHSQDRYARLEAEKLSASSHEKLPIQDRLRKRIIIAPILVFLYTLIWKRLILDGWPGWFYVFQRTLAEILLSLRFLELKFRDPESPSTTVKSNLRK